LSSLNKYKISVFEQTVAGGGEAQRVAENIPGITGKIDRGESSW
jgi:hypothetical protein